jgi:16S rRNA processing protein RimM
LQEQEFLVRQILGLKVVTEDGEELGEIVDVHLLRANDVYVVRRGDEEFLLPAVEDVIVDIDLTHGLLRVARVEGLW